MRGTKLSFHMITLWLEYFLRNITNFQNVRGNNLQLNGKKHLLEPNVSTGPVFPQLHHQFGDSYELTYKECSEHFDKLTFLVFFLFKKLFRQKVYTMVYR